MSLTVHGIFRAIAAQEPDRLFAEIRRDAKISNLTYGRLAAWSSAFAIRYEDAGVSQGDQVVVMVPHGVEQYGAYLAAMEIGAVPSFHTPLNPKSKPELFWTAQGALFETSKPKVVVTDRRGADLLRQHLPRARFDIIVADDVTPEMSDGHAASGENPTCLVQYSSGTTGPRKGVALAHQAVVAHVNAYADVIDLTEEDRIASWLPLYHDMGLITSFLMPLLRKVPVVALDPFEWVAKPSRLLESIESFAATRCWLPNFAFNHILKNLSPDERWNLTTIRGIYNCSEPCRGSTFDSFVAKFSAMGLAREKLQVCYALAENVFAVTQTREGQAVASLPPRSPDEAGGRTLSSGFAIPGVDIKIEDREGVSLAEGERGGIFLKSPFLIAKYLGSDKAVVDEEGWYRTGDEGLLLEGELFVLGRLDDVIVTRGKNIFAHDVEDMLARVPGLKAGRCAVLGLVSEETGTTELALALETAEDVDRKILRRTVVQLVEYNFGIAPSIVYFAPNDWVAKTSSGKISRSLNVSRLKAAMNLK